MMQPQVKKSNRLCEILLRNVELLACLSSALRGKMKEEKEHEGEALNLSLPFRFHGFVDNWSLFLISLFLWR